MYVLKMKTKQLLGRIFMKTCASHLHQNIELQGNHPIERYIRVHLNFSPPHKFDESFLCLLWQRIDYINQR